MQGSSGQDDESPQDSNPWGPIISSPSLDKADEASGNRNPAYPPLHSMSPLEQLRLEYAEAAGAAKGSRMSYMLLGETGVEGCLTPSSSRPPREAFDGYGDPWSESEDEDSPMSVEDVRPRSPESSLGQPKSPRGIMASLPAELRAMINGHLCDGFWQCYQHEMEELKLVGKSHSSPLPPLLRTSSTLRDDFLYSASSAYISTPATIVIGTKIIAFNFPLTFGLVPPDALDDSRVRLPQTRELFIGIQVPSPRQFDHMVQVRLNVKRIVTLLNNIASRSILPPIRVSFETNARNAGVRFYSNDWYTLIGPLSDLRLQQPPSNLKFRKPLLINRCQRFSSLDTEHNTTCSVIEDMVQQVPNDKIAAAKYRQYRQYVMDVKLCLYFYSLVGADDLLVKRLKQCTTLLLQWYNLRVVVGSIWLVKLKDALARRPGVERHNMLKDVASHIARDHHLIRDWTNGHQRSRNPFWRDNEDSYWL